MKNFIVAATAATILVLSMACGRSGGADSELQTFDTANTSIKAQGEIGFCWAYAAVAMIESDYKRRTGIEIDLSEEAIGFFYFAEQIKGQMDYNLRNGVFPNPGMDYQEGSLIDSPANIKNPNDAFSLISRWGLIPESQWSVKFDNQAAVLQARTAIANNFRQTQESLRMSNTAVNWESVFDILTPKAFPSLPPVDGFDNGSGRMNAVKYAKEVIGFDPMNYESVLIDSRDPNSLYLVASSLQRIKEVIGRGGVVGIGVSMPDSKDQSSIARIQGTRFIGQGRPFKLDGGHAMVITDFKNSNGQFGKSLNPMGEVAKPIEQGLEFRLKNSWGSQTGINEFGQLVKTGYYDMDVQYIVDVLQSGGFMILTFPRI